MIRSVCEFAISAGSASLRNPFKKKRMGHSRGHSAVRCRARWIEAAAARRSQAVRAISRGPGLLPSPPRPLGRRSRFGYAQLVRWRAALPWPRPPALGLDRRRRPGRSVADRASATPSWFVVTLRCLGLGRRRWGSTGAAAAQAGRSPIALRLRPAGSLSRCVALASAAGAGALPAPPPPRPVGHRSRFGYAQLVRCNAALPSPRPPALGLDRRRRRPGRSVADRASATPSWFVVTLRCLGLGRRRWGSTTAAAAKAARSPIALRLRRWFASCRMHHGLGRHQPASGRAGGGGRGG